MGSTLRRVDNDETLLVRQFRFVCKHSQHETLLQSINRTGHEVPVAHSGDASYAAIRAAFNCFVRQIHKAKLHAMELYRCLRFRVPSILRNALFVEIVASND